MAALLYAGHLKDQRDAARSAARAAETRASTFAAQARLNAAALRAAEQWIADRRTFWERQYDQLEIYLDETRGQDLPK